MSLTAEQVRWVAHLARLELSDADVARMTPQLSAILDYVDQLQRVNTEADLFAIVFDEPSGLGGAEPRLRMTHRVNLP